jgi:dTDP-4-dehydrorhamnose 3,5-epimerase
MHFQLPPDDHQKIVYCISGRVLDVVVDLRIGGATYGQFFSAELSQNVPRLIVIPRGFAHGFVSLEDNSTLVYKTDCPYAPSSDSGIHWDSFGFRWPISASEAVMSIRDLQLPPLQDFRSPF